MDTLFPLPFDKPLAGVGAVRTWSGMICAAVICKALNWKETSTSSAIKGSCVPDAFRGDVPIEIKSVTLTGGTGKSVIYKFRMEKEEISYPDLLYAFAGHTALGSPQTLSDLSQRLSEDTLFVVLVRATEVYRVIRSTCVLKPVKTGKTDQRCGYNREGYSDGYYCVNVRQWFKHRVGRKELSVLYENQTFKIEASVYGLEEMYSETLPPDTCSSQQQRNVRPMQESRCESKKPIRLFSSETAQQCEETGTFMLANGGGIYPLL